MANYWSTIELFDVALDVRTTKDDVPSFDPSASFLFNFLWKSFVVINSIIRLTFSRDSNAIIKLVQNFGKL
jgi:hypothetical protein